MAASEIWLCKVLMHPGPPYGPMRAQDLNADSHQGVMLKIVSGDLGCLSDGCIVEPIQAYATEALAVADRDVYAARDASQDYRVVLTMEMGK